MIKTIKKKNLIIYSIWLFLTVAVRTLYYLFDYTGVKDSYGFYDSAMIRLEEGEYLLSSGLGFAYNNALVKYLKIAGNNIDVIFSWQLILEIVAISLIFWGARNIWGSMASIAMSCVLSFSPFTIISDKICSPDQYFLFYFSILFYCLGLFYKYTKNHSWLRSTKDELIIVAMGIYTGMLCIWNYMGFLALVLMIYIVIINNKLNVDKKQIMILTGEEYDEKDQIMNGFIQTIMIIFGILIGGFFTLLKYTGYTGYTIVGQFYWWKNQFKKLPFKAMDIDSNYAFTILLSVAVAIIVDMVMMLRNDKKELKRLEELEVLRKQNITGMENAFVEREKVLGVDYFITEDGRKVDYLENPLEGPKKHVPKTLKFDLDEIVKANEEAVIHTVARYDKWSEAMEAKAIGIEKIVKLKANDKVTEYDKIDISSNIKVDDFDLSTNMNDDFDI